MKVMKEPSSGKKAEMKNEKLVKRLCLLFTSKNWTEILTVCAVFDDLCVFFFLFNLYSKEEKKKATFIIIYRSVGRSIVVTSHACTIRYDTIQYSTVYVLFILLYRTLLTDWLADLWNEFEYVCNVKRDRPFVILCLLFSALFCSFIFFLHFHFDCRRFVTVFISFAECRTIK